MKKYLPALIAIILLTGACTKDKGILERPAYAFYDVKFTVSTTPERLFELLVDDKIVTDSLSSNKVFSNKIAAGIHHFQIKKVGSTAFFLDTVINLDKTKRAIFDFLNIDPNANPILFTAGETQAPTNGFYKISVINIASETDIIRGRNVDISFYEFDQNTFEVKFATSLLVPKSGFSEYIELPYSYANTSDAIYILGIKDHDTGEVLVSEQDMTAFFFAVSTLTYNTYVLPMYSSAGLPPESEALFKVKL